MKGIATYGKATHASVFSDAGEAKQKILSTADGFVNRTKSGFGVVMAKDDFVWGSNAVASNQGVWLLHAYYVTGEEKYYKAALMVFFIGKSFGKVLPFYKYKNMVVFVQDGLFALLLVLMRFF